MICDSVPTEIWLGNSSINLMNSVDIDNKNHCVECWTVVKQQYIVFWISDFSHIEFYSILHSSWTKGAQTSLLQDLDVPEYYFLFLSSQTICRGVELEIASALH